METIIGVLLLLAAAITLIGLMFGFQLIAAFVNDLRRKPPDAPDLSRFEGIKWPNVHYALRGWKFEREWIRTAGLIALAIAAIGSCSYGRVYGRVGTE